MNQQIMNLFLFLLVLAGDKRLNYPNMLLQMSNRYLAMVRSREVHKDFVNWGDGVLSNQDPSEMMKPLIYDELTSVVYAEYRIAKNYAVSSRILSDISLHLSPTFSPKRFLDIGSGCGASTLYPLSLFLPPFSSVLNRFPTLQHIVLVDSSEYMLAQSTSLLNARRSSLSSPLPSITTYPSLLSVLEEKEPDFDLICIDRFLSELPSNKARISAIAIAWGIFLLFSPSSRRASSPWRHAPHLRSGHAMGLSFGAVRAVAGSADGGGIEASGGGGAVSARCGVSAERQSEELVSVRAAVRAGADGGV
ncbi:uncharacterized protein [Blastocystis hominis]|uniref:Methyltransferase domain-containing protein n=1 Tax=Blastocystis hominis TaxID=12968 RepID=D8LZ96_BLAHO|nr:uncharacterized protein [Blastocystis hominis]CBK21135.2 unnamed protein product [Blastocystis hominis]|eukprot:XP_012895183.1 uncharacterized protein [Blastocystis hominis]